MEQSTFAELEHDSKKRRTRREVFLEKMDAQVHWQVAMKAGKRRRLDKAGAQQAAERRRASGRAKVEHPFLYMKRHFGYAKVRYRGLAKNTQRIAVLLGFSNLLIAGRYAVA